MHRSTSWWCFYKSQLWEYLCFVYFLCLDLCICVFVYLCICVFLYLCICVFVYFYICVFVYANAPEYLLLVVVLPEPFRGNICVSFLPLWWSRAAQKLMWSATRYFLFFLFFFKKYPLWWSRAAQNLMWSATRYRSVFRNHLYKLKWSLKTPFKLRCIFKNTLQAAMQNENTLQAEM